MRALMRLRQNPWIRELCNELEFTSGQLIQPYFIVEGIDQAESINGLGENFRLPKSKILAQLEKDVKAGVRHALVFFVPSKKQLNHFEHSFSQEVIGEIKKNFGSELMVWIDTCLCSMTSHGHCCVMNVKENKIDLTDTLAALSFAAKCYADAGADGVSPSDMMDGRVKSIRNSLDESGHQMVPVMSYSTKFASQFYGPFRQAASSAPQFGDRKTYQIDVRARKDAIAASQRCSDEGADLLMVKPGMPAMDLIQPISQQTGKYVGAYQVSGEYAGIYLSSKAGVMDYRGAMRESWLSLKRAGAQYIISYAAREASEMGVKII